MTTRLMEMGDLYYNPVDLYYNPVDLCTQLTRGCTAALEACGRAVETEGYSLSDLADYIFDMGPSYMQEDERRRWSTISYGIRTSVALLTAKRLYETRCVHEWIEQPGEAPRGVCYRCGETRE